jgi:L-arabinonolactonase
VADAIATLQVDSRCRLGEAITWCDRRRLLYWCDIDAGDLWRHDPASGDTRRWPLPDRLACLALAEDGRLLLGLAHGLHAADVEDLPDGAAPVLAPLADVDFGDPLIRINDGRADRHGAFVFGGKDERGNGRRDAGWFQYSARHGLRALALPDVAIANGLAFDGIGNRLYFCDSTDGRLQVCDYDSESAWVSAPRRFADVAEGEPDGSCVDAEGALWNAHWGAGRVLRYRADGKVETVLALPIDQPTCCVLADDILYVSSARAGLTPEALALQPQAGGVFAVRLPRMLARPSDRVRLR